MIGGNSSTLILCASLLLIGTAHAQLSPEEAMRRLRQAEKQSGDSSRGSLGPVSDAGWAEKAKGSNFYILVPINGGIGDSITSTGVELALRGAKEQEIIRHVIFYIDSPGGYVAEADNILKVMQEYDSHFTYHAVVKHAISASIWIAFACDTIHIIDGGTIGGAVIFSKDTTGAAQVDEKMNSITLARVVAAAESKGHPPSIVEAMIMQKAEVYTYAKADGGIAISGDRPRDAGGTKVTTIDDARSVLTLTQKQAVELGIAKRIPENVEEQALWDSVGIEGGVLANEWGAHAIGYGYWLNRLAGDVNDFSAAVDRTRSDMNIKVYNALISMRDSMAEATKCDPELSVRIVDHKAKTTYVPNKTNWRRSNTRCYQKWQEVGRAVKSIHGLRNVRLTITNEILNLAEDEVRRVRAANQKGYAK